MSTVSIPLPDDFVEKIKHLIKQGIVPNMSEAVRQAVRAYLEEQAINAVLKADKEANLKGNLDQLAKKL